jgi:DNA modification methylase
VWDMAWIDTDPYRLRDRNQEGKRVTLLNFGKQQPTFWYPQLINDKAESVLPRIGNESIDLIITDPPYGISFASPRYRNKNFDEVFNDDTLEFLHGIGKEFERILVSEAHCYIFTRWDSYPIMANFFKDYLTLQTVIVWDKDEGGHGMGDLNGWAPRYEMIMLFTKGEKGRDLNGKRPVNVIRHQDIRFTKETKINPTQKPRGLMEILIDKASERNEIVADFFGGSYSVSRAAMRLFRKSVGVELNPKTHRMGATLVERDFRNDPILGIDWSKTTNLKVEQTNVLI